MGKEYTRREFLKLAGWTFGVLADSGPNSDILFV